jgi:hypothetical protein
MILTFDMMLDKSAITCEMLSAWDVAADAVARLGINRKGIKKVNKIFTCLSLYMIF